MSNQQVGTVFDRVIQEVCDSSQVDFEESGVDQQTLLDMQRSWQKKLSSLGVAHFPWDPPPPQPTPPPAQPPVLPPTNTVPSNAPRPTPSSHPQQHDLSQQLSQPVSATGPPLQVPVPQGPAVPTTQAPRIKTESGTNGHSGFPPANDVMSTQPPNPQSARERAANMLHQRYGAAAANSVSQLQAQSQAALGVSGQQQEQPPLQTPQVANGQAPATNQPPRPPVNNTQTDGASDDLLSEWKAEVQARRQAAEHRNGEGDRILREHLRQRMSQLEGGGLLLPLDEQRSAKLPSSNFISSNPNLPSGITGSSDRYLDSESTDPPALKVQFDGADDDDEDAINSDLDDPEDVIDEEQEGDDAVGQVMLCTYDKVQRVKSKWKCTLKDGILTTGGREYVFHKGQGEFEW